MKIVDRKHFGYYLSLIAIVGIGVYFIWTYTYSREAKVRSALIVALFYIFWGILHHALHHDLHWKIVVEYVLMGMLGLSIFLFFLNIGL